MLVILSWSLNSTKFEEIWPWNSKREEGFKLLFTGAQHKREFMHNQHLFSSIVHHWTNKEERSHLRTELTIAWTIALMHHSSTGRNKRGGNGSYCLPEWEILHWNNQIYHPSEKFYIEITRFTSVPVKSWPKIDPCSVDPKCICWQECHPVLELWQMLEHNCWNSRSCWPVKKVASSCFQLVSMRLSTCFHFHS